MMNRNWKEIPIPDLMKDLPKDSRGYPVPFIVLKGKEAGVYHFKINDTGKTVQCLTKKLCGVCGKELRKDMWLLGGVASAFHPNGAFVDSPIHYDCGAYALRVCPYLAIPNYAGGKEPLENMLDAVKTLGVQGLLDHNQTLERVPFFCFVHVTGFTVSDTAYIVPNKPYIKVEFWNGGEQISQEQAGEIMRQKRPL